MSGDNGENQPGRQARERLRTKESAALRRGREIHEAVERMLSEPKVRQVGPPVVIEGYLVRVTDHEPDGALAQATAVGPAMGRLSPIVGRLEGIEVEGRHVPTAVLAALLKLSGWKVTPP